MSASIWSAHKMQVRMRVVSDAHDPKADHRDIEDFAVESAAPAWSRRRREGYGA